MRITPVIVVISALVGCSENMPMYDDTTAGPVTTSPAPTTTNELPSTGEPEGTSTSTSSSTTVEPGTGTTVEPTTTGPTTTDATTTTGDDTNTTGDDTTGAPVGCPPDFFCDDFEMHPEGAPPGEPWQTDIGQASALVEAGKAVSGTRAVHIKTSDGYNGRATIRVAVPEVFPSQHLFGRMRMWLTEASPDGVHWTMIEARGEFQQDGVFNGQPFDALLRYGGQHNKRLMANYETSGPGTDCWHHSQQTIPEQKWACMEWEFDSDNSTMRFWIDGTEVADLNVGMMGQGCGKNDLMGQWYYPTLEHMTLGWIDYQNGGGRDLWIDDVAVGPSRVGCD